MASPGGAALPRGTRRLLLISQAKKRALWAGIAAAVALVAFLSTLQVNVNGSPHAYTTDVGEIQNALPRWGLIHRSGYPIYTAVGSTFVTALRLLRVQPAASASLFSGLWGAVAVALLAVLGQELGASGPAAALGALAAGLSTSLWVFASLAEVHTLTLVFSIATLICAVRFGRTGTRRDLLLLALFSSQGVMHQRSVILLAPAVLVLIYPQFRALWRSVFPAVAVVLLAPLTYLYMPFRVWTGATWYFGSPGTWTGFWTMFFDNRGERVFTLAASLEGWIERIAITGQILADDVLLSLLVLGLAGLLLPAVRKGGRRESLAMTLAWAPNLLLTLTIGRFQIGEAQLAAKLPVAALSGIGLALVLEWLRQRSRPVGTGAAIALAVTLAMWAGKTRPYVLSITRDPSAEQVIATAARIDFARDGRPTTLMAAWGIDYWALAYAQAYRGELGGMSIVDHNADFREIVGRGDHLLVLGKSLHAFPISWWERRLGPLYLASAAPDVVELGPAPLFAPDSTPADVAFDLENGVSIRSARAEWTTDDQLLLTVYWEATRAAPEDHSVAVHLVAHDPPRGPEDVLAQADSAHPVGGWYPISRWRAGEIVRDTYLIAVPEEGTPTAIRIALYRPDPDGGFANSPWFSLAVPAHGS